jgi:transposase
MAKEQPKKRNWREERGFRARDLYQQGWKQRDIATALGVTEGAVSQWLSRARSGRVDDLHNRPRLGAPARLSAEQRQGIPALLAPGAEHYGFLGDLWTNRRVAEVIERTFGVRYNVSHVRRLLRALGFSAQKPEVKARQRDERAITTWVQEELPAIKKSDRRGTHARLHRRAGVLSVAGRCSHVGTERVS